MTKHWVVLGCGAEKLDRAAPAIDLYTGPLYRDRLAYARTLGGPHVILSGLHGVVKPERELDPYDFDLTAQKYEVQKEWARRVENAIRGLCPPGAKVIALCSGPYLVPLRAVFRKRLVVPVKGPIGVQRKKLREKVGATEAEEKKDETVRWGSGHIHEPEPVRVDETEVGVVWWLANDDEQLRDDERVELAAGAIRKLLAEARSVAPLEVKMEVGEGLTGEWAKATMLEIEAEARAFFATSVFDYRARGWPTSRLREESLRRAERSRTNMMHVFIEALSRGMVNDRHVAAVATELKRGLVPWETP